MLQMGLHWAGDALSRHGPARVPNMTRAHAYFRRIREFDVDARPFGWHPSLRSFLVANSRAAKAGEVKFQKRLAKAKHGSS